MRTTWANHITFILASQHPVMTFLYREMWYIFLKLVFFITLQRKISLQKYKQNNLRNRISWLLILFIEPHCIPNCSKCLNVFTAHSRSLIYNDCYKIRPLNFARLSILSTHLQARRASHFPLLVTSAHSVKTSPKPRKGKNPRDRERERGRERETGRERGLRSEKSQEIRTGRLNLSLNHTTRPSLLTALRPDTWVASSSLRHASHAKIDASMLYSKQPQHTHTHTRACTPETH